MILKIKGYSIKNNRDHAKTNAESLQPNWYHTVSRLARIFFLELFGYTIFRVVDNFFLKPEKLM